MNNSEFEEAFGVEVLRPQGAEDDYVKQVFGVEGLLSKKFPNYEPRVGQVELAYAVEEAMQEGYNLIAEAPTGTGKSLGYGVSATVHAANGERVVIVTANIALQEQLYNKDLPLLEEILPWKFTYALAKGIGNYLCLDAFEDEVNDTALTGFQGSAEEKREWNHVVEWSANTQIGDISELPFEPRQGIRYRFTTTSDDCLGKKCSHYENCHAMHARAVAKKASIVITNYALFFADLGIKRGGGEGVLPQYTHVVFDEGHAAADQARGFMGFRCSRGSVAFAIKLLDHKQGKKARKGPLPILDAALKKKATKIADALFAELTQLFHSNTYSIRFRGPWEGSLHQRANEFASVMHECSKTFSEAANFPDLVTAERAIELRNMAAKCEEHARNVMQIAEGSSSDWVFFMEEENDRIVLKGLPISVANHLREQLFEFKEGKHPIKSVTVTSATLATSVDDFDYISEQLGVKNAEKLAVESPFDVANNTLLVCPSMPSPSSDRFIDAVARRLCQAVDLSHGRTLCLFTSYRVLNGVYQRIQADGLFEEYPLLKQGTAPRMQLVERFKREVNSVLMGTDSFWAGVDVPGDSLSTVVIDKIPFPNISDPLQDVLRTRLGRSYFSEESVPAAVLQFRQGCGRLLRTVNDRGVIVILDSRVTEKGYGKKFTRAFPRGTRIVRDMGEIRYFLDGSLES